MKIGTDITIQQLQKEYDAVLITIGASTDKKLGLEGEDAEGIFSAVQFFKKCRSEYHHGSDRERSCGNRRR